MCPEGRSAWLKEPSFDKRDPVQDALLEADTPDTAQVSLYLGRLLKEPEPIAPAHVGSFLISEVQLGALSLKPEVFTHQPLGLRDLRTSGCRGEAGGRWGVGGGA